MKKLTECSTGCTAIVTKLNASGPLKQRLISFGIMKGASISLMAYSMTKSTVEIKVGKMQFALRASEAELIEVKV
ncbi:MAG: ferrous iron transport protein A [Epsilonproteobacteria bacterium]|nr:MAG: ferrous iron transport protein A [Campylobacterota bacterium]